MNARPGIPSPIIPGLLAGQRRGLGPAFFWGTATLWTIVVIILDRIAATGGDVPRIGWIGYLLGLALFYLLGGINVVREWERRPIMLFGRYVRTIGPGLDWVDPIFHRPLDDVAVRDVVNELRIGGVQTHDNVPISFNLIDRKSVV